jgi:predicted dehydrogenase
LHGKAISAYVNPDESTFIYRNGNAKEPQVIDAREFAGSDEFIVHYGVLAEDEHFVKSILTGRKPMPDFADALKTMELVERIEAGGM